MVAPLPPLVLTTVKTLPRVAFASGFAAGCGKTDEGLQQVVGGSGPLDIFADAGAHGGHYELGLGHGTDGKQRRARDFLVQQLNGTQGCGRSRDGDIDQDDVGREGLGFGDNRVSRG